MNRRRSHIARSADTYRGARRTAARGKDGGFKPSHELKVTHEPVRSRGIYDRHARGVKRTPGRAEEIAKMEAFKADLARQLEEAGE